MAPPKPPYRIARVDLTHRRVAREEIPPALIEKFLGGRGLGAKLLFDALRPGVDPLSPENPLLFLTGPLMGTGAPGCVKYCVVTKSPLSGTILMSLAGGYFGPELRFAGVDALILEGRAERPVYLLIDDDRVEIRGAEDLWGMPTDLCQLHLRERLRCDHLQIASIGPAAERRVPFAAIISGHRAAGRGGAGAIMASKHLKAIAVRGTRRVEVADPPGLSQELKRVRLQFRDAVRLRIFGKYATPKNLEIVNERGILPTRNHRGGVFEGTRQVNARGHQRHVVRKTTCHACPVACGNLAVVREGPHAGAVTEGPEYETFWSFGAQCGNDCLEAILAADQLCDQMGLDTISTGNVIGFAMECRERGLLTAADLDGLDLSFGDQAGLLAMIRRIAVRQGLGDVLADGVRVAAEKIGGNSRAFAMHVKGLELSGYDPRGAKAMGIAYATSPRGGCHERGLVSRETFGALPPLDRFSLKGKGEAAREVQDETAVLDSLGVCVFPPHNDGMDLKDVAVLFSRITGYAMDAQGLLEAGERIWNLERLFNLREGFGRKDDSLPERLLTEPMPDGPAAGHIVELDALLEDYYRVRHWGQDGVPTAARLHALGLAEEAGSAVRHESGAAPQGR